MYKHFEGLCFPQLDIKFTTKQQRLAPFRDFGSCLRFNIGKTLQEKGHSIALTAQVTARDFNHKVHAMSWTVHDYAGQFESEQLECFEVKRSAIVIRKEWLRIMCEQCDYCLVMVILFPA